MLQVQSPFQQFFDLSGDPLDDGSIYIGVTGQNPETNPIAIFWDESLTLPADQPIKTLNGYLSRAGTPARVYTSAEDYSMTVRDHKGRAVFSVLDATSLSNLQDELASPSGSSMVGFTQGSAGATTRDLQVKGRERKSIDDYTSLSAAFTDLGGAEGTGFGADPVELDLLGKETTFTGILYVPTNISLVNGKLTSVAGRLVFRNPYLANTGLRGYTTYWPYMTSSNHEVNFNCITVINVYIGAKFNNCAFYGLVLVNSNGLWTEYNSFGRCTFTSNAATGGPIRFDGNKSGASTFSTGSGAGTADGSFGYNNFEPNCKIDSTAPEVGITVTDGGTVYNCHLGFQGYARGAGPSGAFLYVDSATNVSSVNQCNFEVHLESFGTAANVISLSTNSRMWYNTGSIISASPEMVMAQETGVDLRSNRINVIGVVLVDGAGNAVVNGPGYMTTITGSLTKREYTLPAFSMYASNGQVINSNVVTRINMDGIEFDTNGNYSDFARFTPTVPGYYQINARVSFNVTATVAGAWAALYKNGTLYKYGDVTPVANDCARCVSSLVYLNGSTDYVEVYGYAFDNGGPPVIVTGIAESYFNGCLIKVA